METWRAFSKQLIRPSRGLVAARRLRRSSVLVFGLGGIGSTVCEILVRTGLGTATIWDVDQVSPSNLSRSAYVASDIGRAKSAALAERLRRINPGASVVPIEGDIRRATPEVIANMAHRHDAALVAADDFALHDSLNALLQPVIRTVYTYVTENGNSGEILSTAPGEPGCVRCLTNYPQRKRSGIARNFRATCLGFQRVAIEAASAVLGILLSNARGEQLFGQYVDPSARLLLVVTRNSAGLAQALPRGFIGGTIAASTSAARAQCPVCG